MTMIKSSLLALNAVCPYYTMYPLGFPLRILANHAGPRDWVLDPFCGRGTTNFAARVLKLPSLGVDSSPIAAAITKAKFASASARQVMAAARHILRNSQEAETCPKGRFWRLAYHASILEQLCRIRTELLHRCDNDARVILRAIILGALHGPLTKQEPSYFSNQCPRTFAPKPAYAVKFWRARRLRPPKVNVLELISRRAHRYLTQVPPSVGGTALQGDSRVPGLFGHQRRFKWIITSPPYYGMRTYIPDQWLRYWFLGGPSEVAYQFEDQVRHSSPEEFVGQLAAVWRNVAAVCKPGAKLVVRFGGINDRKQEPLALVKASLAATGWRIKTARPAGSACDGKRQADQFARVRVKPLGEFDVYALWEG